MREWLQLLGHSDSDVNSLNVIHVAGTKGKGSTCAFVCSLLLAHGLRTGFPRKVGLYTLPDLRCIRERIQINEQLIPEDLFTRYFFEVWEYVLSQDVRPRYLQLLALIAFHTFIKEETDAAIWKTYYSGEYDATNFIQKPVLGPTIENIARHKVGIFKLGAPGFSAPQDPNIAAVLQARAQEKEVELGFVGVDPSLPQTNCSLALALVSAFLKRKVISEDQNEWFLDGVHNELSVKHAVEWFAKCISENQSCIKNNNIWVEYIIFTIYQERQDGSKRIALYCDIWKKIDPEVVIVSEPSIEGALNFARSIGKENGRMETLITGSLHLVGRALNLL
ncbi:Mur ligase [Terfezia claveryi]|nr:Mur ligase [Terfezia claveryi]